MITQIMYWLGWVPRSDYEEALDTELRTESERTKMLREEKQKLLQQLEELETRFEAQQYVVQYVRERHPMVLAMANAAMDAAGGKIDISTRD